MSEIVKEKRNFEVSCGGHRDIKNASSAIKGLLERRNMMKGDLVATLP